MLGASSIAQNQHITRFPVSVPTGTGAHDGWEQPLSFKIINLPKFPVGELPATVSDYVRAVAETTQTSTDMPSVASLAILALCLQGKFATSFRRTYARKTTVRKSNIG